MKLPPSDEPIIDFEGLVMRVHEEFSRLSPADHFSILVSNVCPLCVVIPLLCRAFLTHVGHVNFEQQEAALYELVTGIVALTEKRGEP